MKRTGLTRSKPLSRKKSLDPGKGPLKRTPTVSGALGAAGGPKQRRKPARPPEEAAAAAAWHRAVTGRPCALCGHTPTPQDPRPVEGHHIVSQQELKRHAKTQGYDPVDLLWDARVGLPLCGGPFGCHGQHENGARRVTRAELPAALFSFLADYRLALPERIYR